MRLDESYLARRRFLCGMLGGGAAALGAGVATPRRPLRGQLGRTAAAVSGARAGRLRPGAGVGQDRHVRRDPGAVAEDAGAGQRVESLRGVCTHFDCTVGYVPEKNRIFCACHEGYFDVAGRVLSGPPPRPLREFHMRFHQDQLILALEKEDLERSVSPGLIPPCRAPPSRPGFARGWTWDRWRRPCVGRRSRRTGTTGCTCWVARRCSCSGCRSPPARC